MIFKEIPVKKSIKKWFSSKKKDSPSGEKADSRRNFEVVISPRRSQKHVSTMSKYHNTPSQELNTPRSRSQKQKSQKNSRL